MFKNYIFWLKTAAVLQLLTAGIHSLSFFNTLIPKNDSEKQLLDLMTNYRFDLGGGYHRSMDELMTSFSIAFSLLFVLSGAINLFLSKHNLPARTMKGVITINLVVFLACLAAMMLLTFLPPIICTGLIVGALVLSWGAVIKE